MIISRNKIGFYDIFYDIYRNDFMQFGLLHCVQITFIKNKDIKKSFISIVIYGNCELIEIRNKNQDWYFELLKKDDIIAKIKNEEIVKVKEIQIYNMVKFALKDNIKYIAGF